MAVLPAWGCGQVELVRQASDGTTPLSTSCTVATVADTVGPPRARPVERTGS